MDQNTDAICKFWLHLTKITIGYRIEGNFGGANVGEFSK